jgi:hypothetical protein
VPWSTLQFFSNPSATNEGKTFIGSENVTADGTGKVPFAFSPANKVALDQTITATATSPGDDTSECVEGGFRLVRASDRTEAYPRHRIFMRHHNMQPTYAMQMGSQKASSWPQQDVLCTILDATFLEFTFHALGCIAWDT